MEVPTLELKHINEVNDSKKEAADDRSSPPAVTPTSLPPYSDMDHPFVGPDCKGFSSKGNTMDSDNSSGRETRDTTIRPKSDGTVHALSGLYAQIVVVVAAILVFTEVLHGPIPLLFFHGYLFTYLVVGSLLIFFGIYAGMLTEKCPQFMNREYDINDDKYSTPFMRNLLHSDISIYLRVGAVVFGLGALISSGLEVASLFTMASDCMDDLNSAQTVLRGLFTFFQMHFLFMNAKEIVHALGWFRHAALMHLVATNLSIWIRLVLWESAKDWLDATHHKHNSSIEWRLAEHKEFNISLHTLESDTKSSDTSKHIPTHNIHYSLGCAWDPKSAFKNETEDLIALHLCMQNTTIGAIWEKAMPYLYPFIIQYSLVAAGVIYIIWSNLQTPRSKLRQMAAVSVYGEDPSEQQMNCAGSTRGLFLGLIVLVAGLISLILFFVLAKDKDFNVFFLITSLRCGILGISTLGAVLGIVQIRRMKSKTKREHRLMEMLQRAGMLAVYVFGICCMIVGGNSFTKTQHLLLFLDGMLMVVQACLQSLFIHQVSKKRLGPSNLDDKPGRQVVIFLVFSNMVLWLLESFTTQHTESSKLQMKFFGAIAWPVISRIVMPLVIFYRFHSAVSLMEAWRKSYKIKQN